jgi:hypothetical protein
MAPSDILDESDCLVGSVHVLQHLGCGDEPDPRVSDIHKDFSTVTGKYLKFSVLGASCSVYFTQPSTLFPLPILVEICLANFRMDCICTSRYVEGLPQGCTWGWLLAKNHHVTLSVLKGVFHLTDQSCKESISDWKDSWSELLLTSEYRSVSSA